MEEIEKKEDSFPAIPVCKECRQLKKVGEKTKHCLECLDWKYSDLCK